ncbi:MAG: 16S rRNA (cytosine(1402)-N(4))-methyltransferase RsmH [Bacteroidota bacterium]
MEEVFHVPVLCDVVVELLVIDRDGIYVDCTLGGGGHAEAILSRLSEQGKFIGIDRDSAAVRAVQERFSILRTACRNYELIQSSFSNIDEILISRGVKAVNGIFFDLGVSSYQLDKSGRGFSYRWEEPLDMRMDSRSGLTARELLNEADEEEIFRILLRFGEERHARRIARQIVEVRAHAPLRTTGDLRAIVERSVGRKYLRKSLARVFQAIRIAVNDELSQLEQGIQAAIKMLAPSGRIVVISYHSLEDRIVKRLFRTRGDQQASLTMITKKPITPSEEEIHLNPRARSAKLRCAERLSI